VKDFGNFWVSLMLRSPFHRSLSSMFLLITFRGRKSGRQISTPVNYWRKDGGIMITSVRTRIWWRNLRGGAAVRIRLRGKDRLAQAEVIEAPEKVADGFAWIFSTYPAMAAAFKTSLDANNKAPAADLQRLANDRVLIHLILTDSPSLA
jgi:deazaflavin-dependent oxidoreductase (nitroreductase family)